ncbi:MAG: hypothetical protein L0229_17940 [Blastocatellia bacterium]|nr:hypothetical protein [Blastocatellia bacterium]
MKETETVPRPVGTIEFSRVVEGRVQPSWQPSEWSAPRNPRIETDGRPNKS